MTLVDADTYQIRERLGQIEQRLGVTNERLASLERLMGVLVDELRGLRRDLSDVADLRRRVEVLEAQATR
jgi:hypothetical protein